MWRRETAWGLLSVVLFLAFLGCDSATDESWIRVKQFESADSDTHAPITSMESQILDKVTEETSTDENDTTTTEDDVTTTTTTTTPAPTDYVNVVLENQSASVKTTSVGGEGVTVYKAHVNYTYSGYSFPKYEYPLTIYIPPRTGTSTSTATTSTSGTSTTTTGGEATTKLAIVPYALKSWLEDHVPNSVRETGFAAQATVRFQARTDEGNELETDGAMTILFKNSTTAYTTTSTSKMMKVK